MDKTTKTGFWEALQDPERRRPAAVELDTPDSADLTAYIAGARELLAAGADLITIADCPNGKTGVDSSLAACKLRRELGAEVMPHMTCRDRNRNAARALLMGLAAEGVENVLLVTGDPIPAELREQIHGVYDFTSRGFIRYTAELDLPRPFHIFGALNVNVRNFSHQLDLARQKEECGAAGFFTQPVLTARGLENLMRAREVLSGRIMGGIIPVVSRRNALFMRENIAGIDVDDRIAALYAGADRARGEDLAERISLAVAWEIAPYVDGFYLMTPFGRTGLMARILKRMRAEGLLDG